MKRVLLTIALVISAIVTVKAQQIAVVSQSGSASIYKTFPEAVEGATPGSTVYLPGGGIVLTDTLRIYKRLTIIGVGYNIASGHADGFTTIQGNVNFLEGSSGSIIEGCHISGGVNIGTADFAVKSVTVKYCNLGYITIKNRECSDVVINQNYIRGNSNFGYSNARVTNNIMYHTTMNLDGGVFSYNVYISQMHQYSRLGKPYTEWDSPQGFSNSIISYNCLIQCGGWSPGSGSQAFGNLHDGTISGFEDGNTKISSFSGVFVYYNGSVALTSNFHFTEEYQEYENKVGIYAGSGFNDSGLPPVPYISYKYVPDHTDSDGNLNIKIRAKASE